MLNIIAKRVNSQHIVGHIEDHLRTWRANTDSALIYDLTRVLKYIAKHASKSEVKSNPCLQAYEEIFNDICCKDHDVKHNLKKFMMHVLGQRDVSLYDRFISSYIPIPDEGYIRPAVKPMSKRCTDIEPDQIMNDLMDLKMAVNNHRCRMNGCVKEFNGVRQRCRYIFPKDLSEKTIIKYTQELL